MEKSGVKIPALQLVSYFGYGMGQCFSFGLVGSFILYFYTDIMGISPVTASIIFLIARVWDAVHDPLIASIMDTLRFKSGRYRPFLFVAPFLIFVSTVACFHNIDAPVMTKTIYAAVTYILWGTLYAISDIPFWAMTSVMTDDPQERTKAATCAMLGVNAGIGGTMILFPIVSSWFSRMSNDKGYLAGVIVLMSVGLLLMLNGYFNIKENVHTSSREKVTLRETFAAVRKNKPLFFVLAAFFMNVFTVVANGLYIYFCTYNLNDASLVSVLGTITLCCALACMGTPLLTRYLKKRDLYIALCVLEIIARVIFWFIGYHSVTNVLICCTVITAIFMMTNPLISSMIADTVEYSWYHSGKRCAAITFSGQTFTGKLSVAIAGAASGLILAIIGYLPNTTQSHATLDGIFFCVALLPAVGALLRMLIMMKYTFTEEEHADICEKLERGEFDPSITRPQEGNQK